MPVCRLVPGMDDQCENFAGYWGNINEASKAACKQQYPNCGPLIGQGQYAAAAAQGPVPGRGAAGAPGGAGTGAAGAPAAGQAGGRKRRRGTKKSKRTHRNRRRTTRKH